MSRTGFEEQIVAILPRLRVQAMALTRNRAGAEDLVQDAVCNALSAWHSFVPGTNFAAWVHRILRNRFISDLRRRRDTVDIEDLPPESLALESSQEDRVCVRELSRALADLPREQREALLLQTVHGLSYEQLAERTGCAVGTAKSRVFRARRSLAGRLDGMIGFPIGQGREMQAA
jgi:RNA polymerase sigma-70 factor (ECF subfamily)